MKKSVKESIFFAACDDCRNKTIEEMQELLKPMNSKENKLYNEIVNNCINERLYKLPQVI